MGEVAANQVVAAAEGIVADAYIAELDDARGDVLGDVDSLRVVDRSAREQVRRAQQAGDPVSMARAHMRLTGVLVAKECELSLLRGSLERPKPSRPCGSTR